MLPFKDYSEILPDNYNLAKHRLSSLKINEVIITICSMSMTTL